MSTPIAAAAAEEEEEEDACPRKTRVWVADGGGGCKVARWQNLFPFVPWIVPGWRVGGTIQGKEGIKFCHLATVREDSEETGEILARSRVVLAIENGRWRETQSTLF